MRRRKWKAFKKNPRGIPKMDNDIFNTKIIIIIFHLPFSTSSSRVMLRSWALESDVWACIWNLPLGDYVTLNKKLMYLFPNLSYAN